MLSVANLTKTYGMQVLFDSVSFTIAPGERVGLVGRNGSGKTTILKLILGEIEPDSGTVSIPKGYSIGHLSQSIIFSHNTSLGEACLGLKDREDGADETYRAKGILMGLGFSQADFHRNPSELSSGFQIRLNLARVLVSRPDLLLLDEPTNYLDIVSVRWLGQFLREWRGELIIITHDRAFMDSVTTHTMGIHRAALRKIAGSTHKLYQQVLQDEEVYEKTRINDEKKRKDLEQFINRFRAQATRAKAVQSRVRALQKHKEMKKLAEVRDLDFQFPSTPLPGPWVMDVRDCAFSFDAGPPLIGDLTCAVRKGDRIGVIGKNGKGKTTLLNLMAGNLTPTSGTVSRNQNAKAAYFGQAGIEGLNTDNTVEEEILSVHPEHSRGSARTICGLILFEGDAALKRVGVLSGGEKSRVLLGKILVSPSNVLLLDEPTNHLDMESVDSLIEALEIYDGTVIIATHSEMILHAVVSRLIVFDGEGVFLFEGTYQDFLERVGWKDEEIGPRPSRDVEEGKKRRADKKEFRRLKAELIAERSRTLTPLEREMAGVEQEIMRLEEQIARDNESLVRASQQGQGSSIAALSVAIHGARLRIDELFIKLEDLSDEHGVRAREFEERFSRLEAQGQGTDGTEGPMQGRDYKEERYA